jgi:hypothetical protein
MAGETKSANAAYMASVFAFGQSTPARAMLITPTV